MSDETNPNSAERDAGQRDELAIACEHCGAGPGQWCKTRDGRSAQYLHAPRLRATSVFPPVGGES